MIKMTSSEDHAIVSLRQFPDAAVSFMQTHILQGCFKEPEVLNNFIYAFGPFLIDSQTPCRRKSRKTVQSFLLSL